MAFRKDDTRRDGVALLFPGTNNSPVPARVRPKTDAPGTYNTSADFADFLAYQP